MTTLTHDEHALRLAALRDAMAAHATDALLVAGKGHWWTGRGAMRYLTDFHLWGHDGLVVVPADGALGAVVNSPAVGRRMAAKGFVDDVRGDFNLVAAAADIVRERGLSRATISVVGHGWILSAGLLERLQAALPSARFVPADRLFDEVRAIKSPLEIAQARELWPVMRSAMEAFEAALAPGRPRRAATAEAIAAAHAGGARDVLVFIGEDPDDVEPPTAAPLRLDDVLRIHVEICGESGQWCERTLMLAFRDLTPDEVRLQRAEFDAYDAVRAMARPGVTLSDVVSTYEAALRASGYGDVGTSHHFDLHGQGLDAIEYPRVSSADPSGTDPTTVLRAGMVFSYHPSRPIAPRHVWGPDIHDNVVVTDQGFERLSGDLDMRIVRRDPPPRAA